MTKANGTSRRIPALLAMAALLSIPLDPSSAAAAPGPAVIHISAWVGESCAVGSGALALGSSIGAVRMACAKGAAGATVRIGNGGNFKAGQRHLRGAAYGELLAYDLFEDAAHTIPWADASDDYTVAGALAKSVRVLGVYAVILKDQDVSVDGYSDTVFATIDY